MPHKKLSRLGRRAIWAPGEYQRARPDPTPPPSGVWYALVTNVNAERKAARALDAPGGLFLVYCPMTARLTPVGARTKRTAIVERPLFPRYLFVASRCGAFPFGALRGVCGVESVVRCDGQPVAIPHGIVEAIMRRDLAGEFDGAKPARAKTLAEAGFHADEPVTVLAGAFAGLPATITALAPGHKARLLLEIFGRPTPVDAPLAKVGKVGKVA